MRLLSAGRATLVPWSPLLLAARPGGSACGRLPASPTRPPRRSRLHVQLMAAAVLVAAVLLMLWRYATRKRSTHLVDFAVYAGDQK